MQVTVELFQSTLKFSRHCWICTIWRLLTDMPLLTKLHRQRRYHCAREPRDWTMHQWQRIAFSDESRFVNRHVNGRVRVSRANSCSPNVQQVVHSPVLAVLCFGNFIMGSLTQCCVQKTMKTEDQLHLLHSTSLRN